MLSEDRWDGVCVFTCTCVLYDLVVTRIGQVYTHAHNGQHD